MLDSAPAPPQPRVMNHREAPRALQEHCPSLFLLFISDLAGKWELTSKLALPGAGAGLWWSPEAQPSLTCAVVVQAISLVCVSQQKLMSALLKVITDQYNSHSP